MAMKTASVSVGTTLASMMTLIAGTALAGPGFTCGLPGAPACDAGTVVLSSPPTYPDHATVENRTPYDFLDSVHFQRSPHVSITRIHGLDAKVSVEDSPVGFTKGCHPASTTYCRTGQAAKPIAPHTPPVIKSPVVKAPIVVAPKPSHPAPVYHPPVVVAPPSPCGAVRVNPCGGVVMGQARTTGRVVATGRGFDPSKFTPRVYGDPYTITPGIAHVPTSYVDRDPYRAQAVLDSGQARPNPWTPGGVTPALTGYPIAPHHPYPYPVTRPVAPYGTTFQSGRYGMNQTQTMATHSTSMSRYGAHQGSNNVVCRRPNPTTGQPTCGSVRSRY